MTCIGALWGGPCYWLDGSQAVNLPWMVARRLLVGVCMTVPISPAAWLFGSGLLSLIGIARCKKVA